MKCSRTHSVYVLKAIQWCELELGEEESTRSFQDIGILGVESARFLWTYLW